MTHPWTSRTRVCVWHGIYWRRLAIVVSLVSLTLFAREGTVTSDALGTPLAVLAPGVSAAVARVCLFAGVADLVENGIANLSTGTLAIRIALALQNASIE